MQLLRAFSLIPLIASIVLAAVRILHLFHSQFNDYLYSIPIHCSSRIPSIPTTPRATANNNNNMPTRTRNKTTANNSLDEAAKNATSDPATSRDPGPHYVSTTRTPDPLHRPSRSSTTADVNINRRRSPMARRVTDRTRLRPLNITINTARATTTITPIISSSSSSRVMPDATPRTPTHGSSSSSSRRVSRCCTIRPKTTLARRSGNRCFRDSRTRVGTWSDS